MKSQRQLQIGENIKRIMSEIFLRDDVLSIPGSYITIREADVSPDIKNIRIYIDIFGNESMHEKIVAALNKAAPHFRHQLARRITLRVVPEIYFLLDKTEIKANKIDALIEAEAKFQLKKDVKKPAKKAAPKRAATSRKAVKTTAEKSAKKTTPKKKSK